MSNEIASTVVTNIIAKGVQQMKEQMKDQIKRPNGCEDTPLPESFNNSDSESGLQEVDFEEQEPLKDEVLEALQAEKDKLNSEMREIYLSESEGPGIPITLPKEKDARVTEILQKLNQIDSEINSARDEQHRMEELHLNDSSYYDSDSDSDQDW